MCVYAELKYPVVILICEEALLRGSTPHSGSHNVLILLSLNRVNVRTCVTDLTLCSVISNLKWSHDTSSSSTTTTTFATTVIVIISTPFLWPLFVSFTIFTFISIKMKENVFPFLGRKNLNFLNRQKDEVTYWSWHWLEIEILNWQQQRKSSRALSAAM